MHKDERVSMFYLFFSFFILVGQNASSCKAAESFILCVCVCVCLSTIICTRVCIHTSFPVVNVSESVRMSTLTCTRVCLQVSVPSAFIVPGNC